MLKEPGDRFDDEGVAVTGLMTHEWFRYGKRRVYVKTPDGDQVGWVDLNTGKRTIEQPQWADQFQATIDRYLASQPESVVTGDADPGATRQTAQPGSTHLGPRRAPVVTQPETDTHPTEPLRVAPDADPTGGESSAADWVDLALNVPGQAARTRAREELAAQKDRGKVRAFMQHVLDVKTDERNWRVGADGEETIGAKLEKLTKHGWHVLHAVPIGDRGSDIDHVVIGPGGVFTLNTKTHPGAKIWVGQHAIKVNGQSIQYLRNARFEAERTARLLSGAVGRPVEVTPVLVFLTGTLIPNVTVKQTPDDVRILDRMDVPGAFKRAPTRLTADQVEAIYLQARRSTTWRPTRPGKASALT
jgi:hypothetical protein